MLPFQYLQKTFLWNVSILNKNFQSTWPVSAVSLEPGEVYQLHYKLIIENLVYIFQEIYTQLYLKISNFKQKKMKFIGLAIIGLSGMFCEMLVNISIFY